MNIQATPHADTVQVMAYLYDMSVSGLATLITHGAKTLPITSKGKKQRLVFDMTTTAYNVPAGHKVVLAIDSKDIEIQPGRPDGVSGLSKQRK